jgi:hypothetical protein
VIPSLTFPTGNYGSRKKGIQDLRPEAHIHDASPIIAVKADPYGRRSPALTPIIGFPLRLGVRRSRYRCLPRE